MEALFERWPVIGRLPGRLRGPVVLAVLLLIIVVSYFVARFTRDRPVTYEAVEDHFKYGSTGGERASGIPYSIWKILPRLFEDLLPDGRYVEGRGYASFGFLYEEGHDLPIGVSKRNVQGIDRVFLNCAACHAGTYRETVESKPNIVLGMPSNTVDIGAFQDFLFDCAVDERFTAGRLIPEIESMEGEPDALNRLLLKLVGVAQMRDRLLMIRERFRFTGREPAFGPGRVDTFNPPKVLMNFPIDDLPEREWVGIADLPSIWLQRGKQGMQLHWDGNNTKSEERNRSAAFGTGANPTTLWRHSMERIEDWLLDEAPPPYPFAIDEREAEQGRVLYDQHCSSCHGSSGRDFSGEYVGKVTPIDEVGTDRWRLDSYTPLLAVAQNQLYAGYGDERFSHFRKTYGYANMPLDGLWLRAPYLHNGSVPTVRDLLEPPEQRPETFYRGYDVVDRERLGFVSDVAEEGGRVFFRVDTRVRDGRDPRERNQGNGNGGHRYGTDLEPGEKDAIVEYLKTF